MRKSLHILTILVAASCVEPDKGLLPGLPESVKSIALVKSARTNSKTIIANGTNSIQFEIKYLDENRLPVWGVHEPFVQVWVNDQWELKAPYRFTTEQPGTYSFSLRANDGRELVKYRDYVKAIQPPLLNTYRLPVIFHYLDSGKNLSLSEKQNIVKFYTDSMAVVNNAFGDRRGSDEPNAIDAKIEFYMATEDPEGKALEFPGFEFAHTPGMTSEWESLFANAGDGHYWPPTQYVNVWIVRLTGWNGFAFFPSYEPTGSGYPGDFYGTFIERTTLYMGVTLAHEFGHMLDVLHVFGVDCNDTDMCDDTPPYFRDSENVSYGDNVMRESCDYETFAATNIMDYALTEYTTFTHDQILRMHHALEFSPFLPTERNRANGRKPARLAGLASPGTAKLIID